MMHTVSHVLRRGLGLLLMAACQPAERTPAPDADATAQQRHIDSVVAAGGTVDSILPIAEQLRRFQSGLVPTDTLRHASATREALVARLANALATQDSVELRQMVLDRAEFAYLFYPGSSLSLPPYEAPPQLLWGQIVASSDKGIRRLLDRLGGAPVSVSGLSCPPADIESTNRLHQRCVVQFSAPGRAPLRGSLFGTIVEREGRFKFLGYANRI